MSRETLPYLTEDYIRRMTDAGSFQRGKSYYRGHAIIEPVRQGMELRAECQGSQYEPYKVRVTLTTKGIADYDCSCPRGGFCKHVVALILTYVYEPKSFRVIPPLETLLASCSKEKLIALIGNMGKRDPNLMDLVELSTATALSKAVDVEAYRRQGRRALSRRPSAGCAAPPTSSRRQGIGRTPVRFITRCLLK